MEKSKDILINEYNSHSLLTSCFYIDKYDLVACGDNLGRLLMFDHRVPKPFVQLILSGNKNEISNIQYSNQNNELFFSCDDTIYSVDNITNPCTKKVISGNNIKTNIINENEDGEITDFLLLPDNTIIYPEQEQETFLFYSLVEKENNISEVTEMMLLIKMEMKIKLMKMMKMIFCPIRKLINFFYLQHMEKNIFLL